MADRRPPIRKSPTEILDDLMSGHRDALINGPETAKKYLLKFRERNDSLPNAVKFFLFDLLAEDAYEDDDMDACRTAVEEAERYLPAARADLPQRLREYLPAIRVFERGIGLAIDEGEFERGLALCKAAVALGMGTAYEAKRASIERMM